MLKMFVVSRMFSPAVEMETFVPVITLPVDCASYVEL